MIDPVHPTSRLRAGVLVRHLGLAILVAACAAGPRPIATEPHPLLGQVPAPRRESVLDGSFVGLPAHGYVTLLDFWSPTCKPCGTTMPAFEALFRAKRYAGLVVVGVALINDGIDGADNADRVHAVVHDRGVTYPNVIDGVNAKGTIRGAYGVAAPPQTFLLDRHGRVRLVRTGGGPDDLAAILNGVDVLLGEP